MSRTRKKAVVVCPGRGTYNKSELGYLHHFHADKADLIKSIDDYRLQNQQPSVTELDQADLFDPRIHTRGDNASSLIYACAYADFLSIDPDRFDVIAVTGNSMGWYIALACANSLNPNNALVLIDTMGRLMHEQATGGQVIYPLLDEDWKAIPGRAEELDRLKQTINQQPGCCLWDSILLGGFRVFSGNDAALKILNASLPSSGNYPMRLPNHAAFHSPLMQTISDTARSLIPSELFKSPQLPLVDGRTQSWFPLSSNATDLYQYTLGHQVVETYNFTRAIQVCVQEFAPDCLIIPGPGNTLGGVTAQALIDIQWQGLKSKQDFLQRQQNDPFILSMGLKEQREQLVRISHR
jgi:[acyl-carrier-protein] S-malonyltransferase